MAGSLLSVVIADGLVKAFSAKGLVPDAAAAQPEFLVAVALGAALTVFAATLTGFPISTTHALTGALVGAGLMHVGTAVSLGRLGATFFLPLLVSPILAVALGSFVFAILHRLQRVQVFKETIVFAWASVGSYPSPCTPRSPWAWSMRCRRRTSA